MSVQFIEYEEAKGGKAKEAQGVMIAIVKPEPRIEPAVGPENLDLIVRAVPGHGDAAI